MIINSIVLFVDYVDNMSSRNSCQETLPFKKQWTKQSRNKLHVKTLKILQTSIGEKPVLMLTVVVWIKWHVTTKCHAVVFQSEGKATQETENKVSPPEARSGASGVASRITHRITADTKGQSVASVTIQVICSLNVLAGSAPLSRRKTDNMRILQKILRIKEQATHKMAFMRLFSL